MQSIPRFYVLLLLIVCVRVDRVSAHPHVFIDAEVGFTLEQQELTSLHIAWTYDEFTSLFLLDVLDLKLDVAGNLKDDYLTKVVEGEVNWPEGFNGDVYLERGDKAVETARPINAAADMKDYRITIRFDLPLKISADLSSTPLELRLYDPYYYYAYTVTGVTIESGDAEACGAEMIPFEPDNATTALQLKLAALSRDETPAQADVGRLFSDQVIVSCN